MRLASLNPKLHWSPDGRGYTHQLEFDCHACGPPYRVIVNCVLGDPPGSPGVWGLTLPPKPTSDRWDGVTIRPSIQNNTHGRKKFCGHHFTITSGEVAP